MTRSPGNSLSCPTSVIFHSVNNSPMAKVENPGVYASSSLPSTTVIRNVAAPSGSTRMMARLAGSATPEGMGSRRATGSAGWAAARMAKAAPTGFTSSGSIGICVTTTSTFVPFGRAPAGTTTEPPEGIGMAPSERADGAGAVVFAAPVGSAGRLRRGSWRD